MDPIIREHYSLQRIVRPTNYVLELIVQLVITIRD